MAARPALPAILLGWGAFAATAVVGAAIASAALASPGATDFVAQYAAARLVATGRGDEILDPPAILAAEREAVPERTALLPFVQPPAVALMLAPLGALPFELAYRIMVAIDLVALVVALAMLGAARARNGPPSVLILLLAPPSVLAALQGQTSPLVLLSLAFASRTSGVPAGIALGLSLLRPQVAPLLLLAGLADRDRRAGTAIGAALVVAASVLVVGLGGIPRYLATLVDAASWTVSGAYGAASSIGWTGLALRMGLPGLGLVLLGVSLVAGAAATLAARAGGPRIALAALWSLLASPHVLMHDAVLSYPALLDPARRGGTTAWTAGGVLAWTLHLAVMPVAALWSLLLAVARSLR